MLKCCEYKILFSILIVIGMIQVQAQNKVLNDFGDDDDFSTSSDVYFVQFNWEGPNIPGNGTYGEFIHQETPTDYWVFSKDRKSVV